MLNKLKRLIATSGAALLLAISVTPALAGAQRAGTVSPDIENSACKGSNLDLSGGTNTAACQNITGQTGTQANDLVAKIINIFSIIVGIVSVIMIIYGGFRYVTSGGESSNITTAKNTILYAIIGLIIVALAQFIVKFVLAKATGVNQT
ncbi:MAG TPA: pilin [Candidatus Saccharimonadales bacterium]|nr:pilin [Candidatus Saccharimonadales bacterium]